MTFVPRELFALVVATAACLAPTAAIAATKEECIDAHGRGQDLRDRGQLVRARQNFVTCAQSSCPALVQGDCARFGEELSHLVPTVTFGARDSGANDLPNTTVFVDDVQLTTRLDDGRSHEVDPGKHVVRFTHAGKETTVRIVINQGEKGRLVLATFLDDSPTAASATPAPEAVAARRPIVPLLVAGLGGAALLTGGILFATGMSNVPASCTTSTHECAAPAGDPSFDKAQSSVALANVGIGIGVTGAAMLVGGLIWYFATPASAPSRGFAPRTFVTF